LSSCERCPCDTLCSSCHFSSLIAPFVPCRVCVCFQSRGPETSATTLPRQTTYEDHLVLSARTWHQPGPHHVCLIRHRARCACRIFGRTRYSTVGISDSRSQSRRARAVCLPEKKGLFRRESFYWCVITHKMYVLHATSTTLLKARVCATYSFDHVWAAHPSALQVPLCGDSYARTLLRHTKMSTSWGSHTPSRGSAPRVQSQTQEASPSRASLCPSPTPRCPFQAETSWQRE